MLHLEDFLFVEVSHNREGTLFCILNYRIVAVYFCVMQIYMIIHVAHRLTAHQLRFTK
jgi:hypothetical protein